MTIRRRNSRVRLSSCSTRTYLGINSQFCPGELAPLIAMISIICKFTSRGGAIQEGRMRSWCQVKPICRTRNYCTSALHDAPATKQALFIQGSQVILTEIDQRCHLLVKWEGLVFFLSQAEESFDKGLQTHSCKEKAFIGDSQHSVLQQTALFKHNNPSCSLSTKVKRVRAGCGLIQLC